MQQEMTERVNFTASDHGSNYQLFADDEGEVKQRSRSLTAERPTLGIKHRSLHQNLMIRSNSMSPVKRQWHPTKGELPGERSIQARCLVIDTTCSKPVAIEDIRGLQKLRAITKEHHQLLRWINIDVGSLTQDSIEKIEELLGLHPLITSNIKDLMHGVNHIGGHSNVLHTEDSGERQVTISFTILEPSVNGADCTYTYLVLVRSISIISTLHSLSL